MWLGIDTPDQSYKHNLGSEVLVMLVTFPLNFLWLFQRNGDTILMNTLKKFLKKFLCRNNENYVLINKPLLVTSIFFYYFLLQLICHSVALNNSSDRSECF